MTVPKYYFMYIWGNLKEYGNWKIMIYTRPENDTD